MLIVELFQSIFVSILVGYLALTNTLANGVLSLFPSQTETSQIELKEEVVDSPIPEIASTYEIGGPLPKILIENSAYQEASIGSSTFEEESIDVEGTAEIPIEEKVAKALVNVFCQYKADGYIKTTAGTGFFIHENGVVLTNAHVAQFLLLESAREGVTDAKCVLRTGNPARDTYNAELLYISPIWVHENAKLMNDEHPQGTGERDYALLYVSESVDGSTLPTSFPSLPIDITELTKATRDSKVYTAGYPAEILFEEGANAELKSKVALTTVEELYTFSTNHADLIEVSGSLVSEQGSSGGPIVTENGDAIAMITTKGLGEDTQEVTLRAITLAYINRTITEETGFTLIENMRGDLAFRGDVFKRILTPFLSNLLVEELSTVE